MNESHKKFIIDFYEQHRRMPSYAEIMALVGFKSKNAVYKLMQKLVADGTVEKDAQGKFIFTETWTELPLLGTVEAGLPSPAEVHEFDRVSLDSYLVRDRQGTFLLEVKGDSMIEAHIAEGDYVVAERTEHSRPGDIVIADVDGEWTMKYYRIKNGKPYLEPANKKYAPIYPEESLRIGAIVRGVIRKYH